MQIGPTRAGSEEAVRAIGRRIAARDREIARGMVERYRREIVDYAAIGEREAADVHEITLDNLRSLLANLADEEVVLRPDQLARTRRGAARRVQQGVSLESFLHAFRLWGLMVWETVLATADIALPSEREAALRIAGRVIEHMDAVSTAAAQAYLDEAQGLWSDRELLRRDLLEALITGRSDSDEARRQAEALEVRLQSDYVVAVIRGDGAELEAFAVRAAMRRVVDMVSSRLRPETGAVLVGMREGEVIALYAAPRPLVLERMKRQCNDLAQALVEHEFSVGIGGWHPGAEGVAASYAEAREAAEIALHSGKPGHAVAFDEVLINHILRASPHADRVLGDTLGPLYAYDTQRRADLVPTLRAYFDAGFNVTRAATRLSVNPNTVVYRLKRIKELTGRDPAQPDDLLLLCLGLKLAEAAEPGGERQ